MHYTGSCHCGDVQFEFDAPPISGGAQCNCSICTRKGAVMSDFLLTAEALKITAKEGALSLYQFGTMVGKHYFCRRCGIYPFHETLRTPGSYRLNLNCVDGVDARSLPLQMFDGKSL